MERVWRRSYLIMAGGLKIPEWQHGVFRLVNVRVLATLNIPQEAMSHVVELVLWFWTVNETTLPSVGAYVALKRCWKRYVCFNPVNAWWQSASVAYCTVLFRQKVFPA